MANHPGSITKRGPSYRIRLCVGGKRHYFTLKGVTKEQAEQFARERDTELRGRNGRGLPEPEPFSSLLARYRRTELPQLAPNSRDSYGISLDAFKTYFVQEGGDPPAHEITKGDVNGFMTWRRMHSPDGTKRKKPLAARTVAKDRVVLHVLFSFAEGLEIVPGNPVGRTTSPKGDQREPLIINADQYERLLEACAERPMLALYVLVLGETGVRCDSEALWLRWADVDLASGLLTVESVRKGRRTKSGKSRRVPMTPRLRTAVADHMARYRLRTYNGKRTEWIFHHQIDRRHAKAGDRLGSLRRAFQGAVKRAKLPEDLRQHDLRHRRVTTWLAEGKPIKLVSKAMGHSTVKVTEKYEHLMDRDLLSLVNQPTEAELRALVAR